ncbi:metalloprotease [Saitoella coloradoensis]
MNTLTTLLSLTSIVSLLLIRLLLVLPGRWRPRPTKKPPGYKAHLMVMLGSGGHTAEMITMLGSLDMGLHHIRTYVVSSGDSLSAAKAKAFEDSLPQTHDETPRYRITTLPRARRVGQSFLTTPLTALLSFLSACHLLLTSPPDLILANGPGTCVTLILAAYIPRFLGLGPRMVYVESFARVRGLSLSGRLVRPVVDRFLVQWEGLVGRYPGVEYRGVLVADSTSNPEDS